MSNFISMAIWKLSSPFINLSNLITLQKGTCSGEETLIEDVSDCLNSGDTKTSITDAANTIAGFTVYQWAINIARFGAAGLVFWYVGRSAWGKFGPKSNIAWRPELYKAVGVVVVLSLLEIGIIALLSGSTAAAPIVWEIIIFLVPGAEGGLNAA